MWGIQGVRLPGGEVVDVLVDKEAIAAVGPGVAASATEVVAGDGKLLLPAFIDTHIHLDKALTRPGLEEHDGTLAGAIRATQVRKRRYTVEDVAERAADSIAAGVLTGTTRFRSHVDIDGIAGLVALEGVQEAARRCRDIAEVQTVAFPQEGLLRDPAAMDLMHQAMAAGADVVGGMPHWESHEPEQREHVRFCFELAERHDRDVDMHVDETDDGSIRTLEMVADEALRRKYFGRVTAGHVCSLAAADDDYARRVIEKCAEAEITIVSNPVTNLVLQGRGDRSLVRRGTTRIAELRAAGVNLCFGQDCVLDGFYPFGRGDMLEVALISAHAAHLTTGSDLAYALQAITAAPARSWRLPRYGLVAGSRADFQLMASPSWAEALRRQQPPERVWFTGREVARSELRQMLVRQP